MKPRILTIAYTYKTLKFTFLFKRFCISTLEFQANQFHLFSARNHVHATRAQVLHSGANHLQNIQEQDEEEEQQQYEAVMGGEEDDNLQGDDGNLHQHHQQHNEELEKDAVCHRLSPRFMK